MTTWPVLLKHLLPFEQENKLSISSLLVFSTISTILISYLCVGAIRELAIRRAILDIPNERSSHSASTPRGGGGGIVIGTVLTMGFWGFLDLKMIILSNVSSNSLLVDGFNWIIAICIGGIIIGILGWLDDCYSIGASIRLGIHFLLANGAVFLLKPIGTPAVYHCVAVLWIMWATNFFNFMDGIDGLAASEAVFVGLVGGYICGSRGIFPVQNISLLVAGSALGFLFWNFPPAKIFLGDSGSGFLGYVFGCLSIGSGFGFKGGIGTWVILLSLFWGDATFTLFRRIWNRERFWEAHRSHLYQRAVQRGFSHLQVLIFFMLGNVGLAILAIFLAEG